MLSSEIEKNNSKKKYEPMLANYKTRDPDHLNGSTKSRKTMNPKF